ncbi:MAG: DNA double-strand break repair nuclease NurA [Candidatus Methylarchaceae archaeon HK02M1]|nr:DNA double-strand break repair nuclease NurA [Candidatus Methylarchaceae archaeon HK01M]MCP8311867.1 DNA double-strand break repair nuclease NurA [Candidatus Methylarchaceae archaeon HK02M1]
MSVEAIRIIVKNLDQQIIEDNLGNPFFSNPDYKSIPFNKDSFRPIKSSKSDKKIAFIDGGNQEVLGAPNFSVQINRVCFNIFKGKERIREVKIPKRIEFFSTTYSTFREGEIFYDTMIFPLHTDFASLLPDEKDLSFNSWDRTVTLGTQRADIERVASIARRFAEWQFSQHVIEQELREGDVIVMDGTLQTALTNEGKYCRRLYQLANSKGVLVTGLSKTSQLYTDTGLSLIGAIYKLSLDSSTLHSKWYLSVAEAMSPNHDAMILVVKLHEVSEHIFRYEIQRGQFLNLSPQEIEEILAQLALNSSDVSFPGYPYGLIDADKFARIRNDEVGHYQSMLLSEISKLGKWEKFVRHIHAVDSHNVLNLIMG